MPELPEVEYGRKCAEFVALGRRIVHVSCADDPIVFDNQPGATVRKVLEGRQVLNVARKGKYIWFELDKRPWPIFHFGMTGDFRSPQGPILHLASHGRNELATWPPRFPKIHLLFDDGGELVMTNKRRLGRIRIQSDPLKVPPISKLGFDPLLEMPSLSNFRTLLKKRKRTIKGLLLDQSFIAGVGNWIADEVLYQAQLHPERRAHQMTEKESQNVYRKLIDVIGTAVSVDARKDLFPADWLFHRRWGKAADTKTIDGKKIIHIDVAGRTSAIVPSLQKNILE
jgi:formamidopyrimidine-DNA glycosylase